MYRSSAILSSSRASNSVDMPEAMAAADPTGSWRALQSLPTHRRREMFAWCRCTSIMPTVVRLR